MKCTNYILGRILTMSIISKILITLWSSCKSMGAPGIFFVVYSHPNPIPMSMSCKLDLTGVVNAVAVHGSGRPGRDLD